jgi:hypothetical protein
MALPPPCVHAFFTVRSLTHCMRSQDLNARVSKQFAPQAILLSWGKKKEKKISIYLYIYSDKVIYV